MGGGGWKKGVPPHCGRLAPVVLLPFLRRAHRDVSSTAISVADRLAGWADVSTPRAMGPERFLCRVVSKTVKRKKSDRPVLPLPTAARERGHGER